jgi:hypothetical protein
MADTSELIEHGKMDYPNATDSVVCVCGNDTGEEGFMQCDAHGVPASLSVGEMPAGLSKLREDGDNFMACHSCGRIYSDKLIEQDNDARVVGRLSTDELHAAQDLYWEANDF